MRKELLITHGDFPTAEQHNGVLDQLLRNRLHGLATRGGGASAFPHPWRVRTDRSAHFASGPATQIYVAAGTINDQLPAIPYRRVDDPRGWSPPSDYQQDPATSSSPWIDRDALDDPDDPPFLLALDPAPGATECADWILVTEDERPFVEEGAFCGADDWALELWRCHVVLSATPLQNALSAQFPPPALKRFRLYAAKALPAPNSVAAAGGAVEIAALYLLRSPGDPASAEVRVRQQEWWPLWTALVQPGQEIFSLLTDAPQAGAFATGLGLGIADGVAASLDAANAANLATAQGQLDNLLSAAASVEFWTV